MATLRDPWTILGLAPGTPWDAVRTRYVQLIRQHHPDRYADNPDEQRRQEELTKDIIWAYHELEKRQLKAPSRPRPAARPSPPVWTPSRVTCARHGRWAVIFCTVCGEPLCTRCDSALTGFCPRHRSQRRGVN